MLSNTSHQKQIYYFFFFFRNWTSHVSSPFTPRTDSSPLPSRSGWTGSCGGGGRACKDRQGNPTGLLKLASVANLREKKIVTFMWYSKEMFRYVVNADFVTLASLKVPSGSRYADLLLKKNIIPTNVTRVHLVLGCSKCQSSC